jgi:catechol 2,3-dioxygenase-like lactoylglutathione lyase family enzyme
MEPTVMTTPLGAARAITKIPAQDLDRARRFYRARLGLDYDSEFLFGLDVILDRLEQLLSRG